MTLTFGSLFAGIGGFDLGFERAGMVCRWQVEIDDFCNKVLAKHWPDVTRYRDVRKCGKHNLEPVDVLCGGFPCQDISEINANGKGLDGDLSKLWWEYYRIIGELRPKYAVVENVSNLTHRGLTRILGALSEIGLDAEWQELSACAFGAPHMRHRMFIVAYPNQTGLQASRGNGNGNGHEAPARIFGEKYLHQTEIISGRKGRQAWAPESGLDRMADGVSAGMVVTRNRLKSLGNAVVPQVAEFIGGLIVAAERAELPLEPGGQV